MRKSIAAQVLTAIVLPVFLLLFTWAGATILEHDKYIAGDKEEKKSLREIAIESRADIREIRTYLMGRKNESLRTTN